MGYDREVRERVCTRCKVVLDSRDLEERVAVSFVFKHEMKMQKVLMQQNTLSFSFSDVRFDHVKRHHLTSCLPMLFNQHTL